MKRSVQSFIILILLVLSGNSLLFAQRVTITVSGDGTTGYSGDGGAAMLAQLNGPKDVCMDAAENIYFVDKANGRIRKISAREGQITTVAGGGAATADGVPATTAAIDPNYMCISNSGDIYFTMQHEVKMVSVATGIITTIAGSSVAGGSGDGGLAVAAALNNPMGICVDASDNVYIVDRDNSRVREITAATKKIKTIAGLITAVTGAPTGDGGAATAAELYKPVCICVSPAGDVYFSDNSPFYPSYDNSVIRKIEAATGIITIIAGDYAGAGGLGVCNMPPLQTIMGTTTGLCFSHGCLYCNEMSCSCRKLDFAKDTLYLVAGNFGIESYSDDTMSAYANMNNPYGLCVDNSGSVYVADYLNQRIRKILELTNNPVFARGQGIIIDPSLSSTLSTPLQLDSMLQVTDIDAGQTETWTVVMPPVYGTLSGFPATAVCRGDSATTKASGLYYTALSSYKGGDYFRVRVTDGTASDTINVYVGAVTADTTKIPDPLSIPEFASADKAISVFPNPATNLLNIRIANMQEQQVPVIITDAASRIICTARINNNSNGSGTAQVNIAVLPSGIYFARSGMQTVKFIKE